MKKKIILFVMAALSLALGIVYVTLENMDLIAISPFVKTAASLGFVGTGLLGCVWNHERGSTEIILTAGLFCGAIGDILMDFTDGMVGVIVAFLLGHILYSVALIRENRFGAVQTLSAAVVFVVTGIYILLYPRMYVGMDSLKIGVWIYLAVISFMVGNCVGILMKIRSAGKIVIAVCVGGILFYISDFLLLNMWFAGNLPWKDGFNFLNSLTYFLAQNLFALSCFWGLRGRKAE